MEAYREQVATFLKENLPDGWAGLGALDAAERAEFLPRWRETLLEHGYLAVNWPTEGISMLLVPIVEPGVLVRPIRSMTGDEEFCEVFFEDARTAAKNIVGARGEGASVTMTLLGFERGSASGAQYLEHRQELERLVALAREHGRDTDPVIRQRIAWAFSKVEVMRLLGLRALTVAQQGRPPGAESSVLKLFTSEFHSRLTELAMDVLSPAGLVRSGGPVVTSLGPPPRGVQNTPAAWQNVYLTARAATIYGGSSQVQRNTLGERVLGLPREPRPAPAKGSAW